jgi:hypothetical protein
MKLKQDESPGTMAKPVTQEAQDLMTASWVPDMTGIGAELELADFITADAKTAKEIAKAKGLDANAAFLAR